MKYCSCKSLLCFLFLLAAFGACKGKNEGEDKRGFMKNKERCCGIGQRLAKHGYTECKWSQNLIKNIDRIDRQWMTKSPTTGAFPAQSLINLRRLRKCKRFKYIFNRCCETEKVYNEVFLKTFLLRLRQMSKALQKRMSKDVRFNKELTKQVME